MAEGLNIKRKDINVEKTKIGLVGVCSHYESGSERYDELIDGAASSLRAAGLEVCTADKPVYSAEDALAACDKLRLAEIESLVIMNVTWVCDSLLYLFINELKLPTAFWAVPYTETFSIGCVQNFGSAMHSAGVHYEYVYGLPSDSTLIDRLRKVALCGHMLRRLSTMRIALVGPRQTWRVAGPQDMSIEEWEFSRTLGPTLVHIEMEEIIRDARSISDTEAEHTLHELKKRTGRVLCSDSCLCWMAKVYTAVKKLMIECRIEAIAAECYPNYSGLMNLPSSWLEDEGFIVDTEGDIAHAMVKYLMNMATGGGSSALGEIGSFDDKAGFMSIAHEGSSPASLAASLTDVQITPSGENGCFVGFPVKPMSKCTVCTMQGSSGSYRLMLSRGQVLSSTHEEWVSGGEKLLVKLRIYGIKPSSFISSMIDAGMHHHIVIKDGDHCELFEMLCKYINIEVVRPQYSLPDN